MNNIESKIKTDVKSKKNEKKPEKKIQGKRTKTVKHQRSFHRQHLSSVLSQMKPLIVKHLDATKKLKAVKEGYFGKDSKDPVGAKELQEQIDSLQREMDLLKGIFRSSFKNTEMAIELWDNVNTVSAATTAMAPVYNVLAQNSAEFSALKSLFDEFKMISVEVYAKISQSAGGRAASWGWAWDPMDNSAYGSMLSLLPSFSKRAPLTFNCGGFGSPGPDGSHDGFIHKLHRIPSGTQVSSAAGALAPDAPGTWMDVQDSTGVKCGYIKSYVEAASAGTCELIQWIGMKCVFRCRT